MYPKTVRELYAQSLKVNPYSIKTLTTTTTNKDVTHLDEYNETNDWPHGDTNNCIEQVCNIEFPQKDEEEVDLDPRTEFVENQPSW